MSTKLHVFSIVLLLLLSNLPTYSEQEEPPNLAAPIQQSDVLFWITGAASSCGEEFCATVRVRDFQAVERFGFSLNWDPGLLTFVSSELMADSLFAAANFDDSEVMAGRFGFSWQAGINNPNGLTLDRDQAILNICMVDRLAASATVPINFADQPINSSISSANTDTLNFVGENIRAVLECDRTCLAGFSFSVLDSCGSVQFYNESIGDALTYNWNFGDGTVVQTENPNHTYTSPKVDPYTVLLEVRDTNNCQNEFMDNILITGQDNTPPTIICPPDTAVDCTVELIPMNTGEPIIMDNCGINDIQITFTDEVTTEATCSKTIKRTWIIVDKSNNIESCIQIISAIDQSPPSHQ